MTSEATGVRAPADSFSELAERLVDTGIPWNTPAPTFAIPWATDSWFDVDPVAVPGRKRPGVARGLREADQQQRRRRDPDHRQVVADDVEVGKLGRREARAGRLRRARRRGRQVEEADASSPPTTSTSAPGIAGAAKRSPRITASATTPTSSVAQWMSPSVRSHDPELPPGAVAVGGRSGQLRQLADDDVDRGAGEEAGHDRLREELGDPAQLETASSRNSTPVSERDRRHELRRLSPPRPVDEHRTPGDRGKRGARPGRDLPRRAEQRVDEAPAAAA